MTLESYLTENTPYYHSRVVNYERKLLIRLATDLVETYTFVPASIHIHRYLSNPCFLRAYLSTAASLACAREHTLCKGKYHCTAELLLDWFGFDPNLCLIQHKPSS